MDEATEGSTPLPPPPPSGLVGNQFKAKPLTGLLTSISVLVPITAGLGLLFALLNELALDDAQSFLAGAISETEFVASYGPGLTLQLAQTLTQLGAGISVIIWMRRIASNHEQLGRVATWRPAWAIGGWFVPPLILYVIPFLMFRELWKATDGDQDSWRDAPTSPLTTGWFIAFGVVPTGLAIRQWLDQSPLVGSGATAMAETAINQRFIIWGSAIASIVSAALFVLFARQLTRRHQALLQSRGIL
jgi:hypothetical protein